MDESMDELFDEVLAICLDRLSDGDTVEACMADFPECPDMRPLLELAAALSELADDDRRGRDASPTWLKPRRALDRLRPTG
jgi:hypothetical protein